MSFLMKCVCSSMCFLCWCFTECLHNWMALWLSNQSVVLICCFSKPNSNRICRSHMASLLSWTATQCFASTKEREMALCFLQYQVIGLEPRVNTKLAIDFRSSRSPTQLESLKPIMDFSLYCNGSRIELYHECTKVLFWLLSNDFHEGVAYIRKQDQQQRKC